MTTGTETAVFQRLLPYLRPHARTIGFGLLLLLISIPASNFHPLAWAYIVDQVIGHRHAATKTPLCDHAESRGADTLTVPSFWRFT